MTVNGQRRHQNHAYFSCCATFVVAASLATSGVSAEAPTAPQVINFSIVSQCGPSAILNKAYVTSEAGRETSYVRLTRETSEFYTGHVAVLPGRYNIGVNVGENRDQCFGGSTVAVLPGRQRDIGIRVGRLGSVVDAHAFLYGTLPMSGFFRGDLVGRGFDNPVDIDHLAYYINNVWPGVYLLKLFYGPESTLECRTTVTIPAQGARDGYRSSPGEVLPRLWLSSRDGGKGIYAVIPVAFTKSVGQMSIPEASEHMPTI
jgi:hypothetical protein